MKRNLRILSFLLSIMLICVSFTACKNDVPQGGESFNDGSSSSIDESVENSESSEISEPENQAPKLYADAVEKFKEQQNFEISVEIEHERKSGLQTFIEESEYEIKFLSYGTDDMRVYCESELGFMKNEAEITEIFADGKVYQTYNGVEFTEEMTAAEYLERIVNPILLNAELYGDIHVSENSKKDETIVVFGSAKEIEKWAAPEYAELIDATGKAVIDAEGNIISNSCELSFEQGIADVRMSVSVEIEYYGDELPTVSVPENNEDYQKVDNIDAILQLFKATSVFEELSVFEYNITEISYFTGAPFSDVFQISGSYFDDGEEFLIKSSSNIVYVDSEGQEQYSTKFELDGLEYTIDSNGETNTTTLTKSQQRELFEQGIDEAVGFDIDETYIENVFFESVDGYLVLTAKGNDDYDAFMRTFWSDYIYSDSEYLDEIAQSYKKGKLEYVITIDADTYLPVALNFDYDGIYTANDYDFDLGYEKQCSLLIGNPNTYERITGEHYADFDKEPTEEEKATPLFYKVTGKNGETLYLLGTIHIGDNRTAYLPDEIYSAFASSDALAVELNVKDSNDIILDDEELLQKYYEGNYYLDGSKLSDHIDEELFESAKKLSEQLGIGGYGDYIGQEFLSYKPNFIYSKIQQQYIYHHELSTSKGVDMRLIEKAEADGMKIYEVEEWDESLDREAKYSDKLCEMLLESALDAKKTEYISGTSIMFDAWCRGDIKMLTELVNNDELEKEDLTEEELEAVKEYDDSLSTNRDKIMLEKAIEYLESGETVFVAVGLAHIIDSDTGLVKTLAESGYTVELVEFE